jgi:hypothetical protein
MDSSMDHVLDNLKAAADLPASLARRAARCWA